MLFNLSSMEMDIPRIPCMDQFFMYIGMFYVALYHLMSQLRTLKYTVTNMFVT